MGKALWRQWERQERRRRAPVPSFPLGEAMHLCMQHMHHDAILASSARQLLQQLVTAYPSTRMVIVSLHTFTLLAASSLVDTPKQVISVSFKLPFSQGASERRGILWRLRGPVIGSSFIHLIRTDSNVFFLMAESFPWAFLFYNIQIH